MKPDAKSEGLCWLEQATADRRGAQLLLDGTSYYLACFVAQQVAEKALKAFIYAQGEEFVIGHSVEAVAPLDGYYIPTRYPNALPDSIPARVYTRRVAEETLRMADQALDWVREKLQSER